MNIKLNPYLIVIIGASLAGGNAVLARWLQLPATTTTFTRLIVPAVILFIYLKFKKIKIIKGNYKLMLIASTLNAIRMPLFYLAFLYTTVANGIIIASTWPIFATIFGFAWLKEKMDKKTVGLIMLSFLGVLIMYSSKKINLSNADLIGMLIMLVEAILYALTMIIFKKEAENYSTSQTIFYQNIVGAIILLPVVAYLGLKATTVQLAISFTFFGLITGILIFLLFFYSLKRIKISHYSLLTYLEVPASIFCAIIFLGEKISLNILIGGALIIFSSLQIINRKQSKLLSI